MRFKKASFFSYQKVGEDELKNPIYDDVLIGEFDSKLTQWTTEEIALLERTVTQNQRKLLTKASLDDLKATDSIKLDDVTYTIVDVKSDFTRWRLVHVEEWKE